MKNIVVIGSCNTDMVIKTDRLPTPGETVLGGTFLMNAGGKGANQAVTAARQGGQVTFISKTGNDVFGKQSVELYNAEGINTDFIFSDPKNPSGVALHHRGLTWRKLYCGRLWGKWKSVSGRYRERTSKKSDAQALC
jgi:sugar/nucleoside kinase (ribokinase family)